MNVESLIGKFTQYFSWPYDRQWEGWALSMIVMAALVLLILAGRAQAKSRD